MSTAGITETPTAHGAWFSQDRFGMFIHWGLYAIPARGEWVRSVERISVADYQVYFDEFNPVDFNPREWARIAKEAGMRYAVMTAKHHDGFCLYDSALTDYKATNTICKRDLVREFLDAFREAGLKVGLYYSLLDWYHPDYPHFGDRNHPMRDNEAFRDTKHDFNRYLEYMHGQVRELCTNYGKLDLLWFDFSYDDMTGEKWRANALLDMVRDLQPGILVNNRLGIEGDFTTPEQIIPPTGIRKADGTPMLWESCLTMNNNWGYAQFDKAFYPASVIVRKLVECVSKGGNLLLNVGPDARGRIPRESVAALQEVGRWMHDNGSSIYGCGAAVGVWPDNKDSLLPKPEYGRFTFDGGNRLYIHVTEQTIGPIYLQDIQPEQIKKIRLIATGAELAIDRGWITANIPGYTFIQLDGKGLPSYTMPDAIDTVVMIELET